MSSTQLPPAVLTATISALPATDSESEIITLPGIHCEGSDLQRLATEDSPPLVEREVSAKVVADVGSFTSFEALFENQFDVGMSESALYFNQLEFLLSKTTLLQNPGTYLFVLRGKRDVVYPAVLCRYTEVLRSQMWISKNILFLTGNKTILIA